MGLDMYLHMKVYTSKYFGDPALLEKLQGVVADALPMYAPQEGCIPSVSVELPLMYWRKSNQIHGWFVANVQNGVDDCGDYLLDAEKLRELQTAVKAALAARSNPQEAAAVLPPVGGFFFGSTEMDDWYWADLENTERELAAVLEMLDQMKARGIHPDLYYHSSW